MSNHNLIINGDFETDRVIPSASNWHVNYLIEHTPTGWSTSSAGVDLLNDEHGKFGAVKTPYGQYVELDGRRNTSIEQTISTIAGQTYSLSFDWALPSYEGGNYSFPDQSSQFQVKVNDEIVFEYDGSYGIRNEWTNQALNFRADSSETKISFTEIGYSDAEGTLLDNISITSYPAIRSSKVYEFNKPSWFRIENREGNGSANSTSKPKNGEIWLAGAQHNQNNNSQDAWIARYTTGGEIIEEKIMGEASNDYAIAVEEYEGDAIYSGTTYGEFAGNANKGRMDAFAFRYDRTNSEDKWINQIASSSSGAADWATNVVIDSDKNIYATGNSGFGASINGQSGLGQHDGYVVKISPNGDTLWTNLVGSSGNDSLTDGVATNDNNMVFVGSTNGRVNGATHNGGEINYLNGYDGYIAKYSTDGNHIWSTQVGGNDNERVLAVAKTPEDDLIVAGYSEGKVTTERQPGAGGRDIFISKVTSSGERLWEKTLGGEGNEIAYDIEVLDDGRIILVGSTDGDLWESESRGKTDAFIIQLTDNGEIIETTVLGTDYDDVARSIRSGESGEIVISGYTEGGLFGSDSNGSMNAFIAYYEPVENDIIQKIRGNSLYTIIDGPSWTQAEANSAKLGGQLITINSQSENKYIIDSGILDNVESWGAWIGLYQRDYSEWNWSSDQSKDWLNWNPGEPSGDGLGNGDAHLYTNGESIGMWNDVPAGWSAEINQGIAEIPFIRRGDSAYVIVEGPTREEAEANAVKLGGSIVSDINDYIDILGVDIFLGFERDALDLEEMKISGNDQLHHRHMLDNELGDLRIAYGFTDDGPWQMLGGDGHVVNSVVFQNQSKGNLIGYIAAEPDSYYQNWVFGSVPHSYLPYDFLYRGYDSNGKPSLSIWDLNELPLTGELISLPFNEKSYLVVESRGKRYLLAKPLEMEATEEDWGVAFSVVELSPNVVAEIKLAPNTAPTGTPILTGDFKDGQTISIDASAIEDADNFEGWTPTYEYSWEISDGNGSTWTALTNTDATDGDDSYTLTSAEVGKQLRGVVSYLDGYGTNEVVKSESSFIENALPDNPYQEVFIETDQMSFMTGSLIHFPLLYSTSTNDSQLPGLTLNLHYDSSVLLPTAENNGVVDQLNAAIKSSILIADTNDLDQDPRTDSILQMVWASFDSSFPGTIDLPAAIATVSFNAVERPEIDPVTGEQLTTSLNTTSSGTAAGYEFLGHTTNLTAQSFNLDVDGDGRVSAFSDGLMVIRKLLGASFAGDALTSKAISPNATRTTAEIHEFIQAGIDGGFLDVDLDDEVAAFSDGLMVIRRMFGPTFANEKLIDKAIGPRSRMLPPGRPFHDLDMPGKADLAHLVGERIDSLMPDFF